MPAWAIPLVIQAGESLAVGIGTAAALHQGGMDWTHALTAGLTAAIGKAIPSQLTGKNKTNGQ